jgi:DNA-binding MarR family transcriptional regulator
MPQFGVLMFLYHGGQCGVHDVGQRLEVTDAAASQIIERLVQAGLVARTENPTDRRARLIALTDKGCALVEQGISERHRWLDELVAALDEERRHAVLAALPLLIEAEKRLRGQKQEELAL